MTFRRITRRRIDRKDAKGIPISWIETMECGHTNTTAQRAPLGVIPCLTCEKEAGK